mmetsp:Transcript_29868/g.74750  ORF Transcript_29868/g.74750 Transcript_29868/m.74750 type:complete len:307 (+) Transcript_29868:436-1356(+)
MLSGNRLGSKTTSPTSVSCPGSSVRVRNSTCMVGSRQVKPSMVTGSVNVLLTRSGVRTTRPGNEDTGATTDPAAAPRAPRTEISPASARIATGVMSLRLLSKMITNLPCSVISSCVACASTSTVATCCGGTTTLPWVPKVCRQGRSFFAFIPFRLTQSATWCDTGTLKLGPDTSTLVAMTARTKDCKDWMPMGNGLGFETVIWRNRWPGTPTTPKSITPILWVLLPTSFFWFLLTPTLRQGIVRSPYSPPAPYDPAAVAAAVAAAPLDAALPAEGTTADATNAAASATALIFEWACSVSTHTSRPW